MTSQPDPTLISSRRFGDATVTLISEGTFPWNPELLAPADEVQAAIPEADANGEIVLGANIAHIRLGDASILVDPGFDDPGESEHEMEGHIRTAGLTAGLREIGVTPEDITHVLITHAHGDHFVGATTMRDGQRVARYPNAHYFIGRAEWEANPEHEQPDSELSTHLGTLLQLGQLTLVDGDKEVVPGVTLVAAPGESAGHSIVRVDAGGSPCLILGDLFHHTAEVEHTGWVSLGRDAVAAQASRERTLQDAVATDATMVYSHAPFPGWGHITSDGTGYRWVVG